MRSASKSVFFLIAVFGVLNVSGLCHKPAAATSNENDMQLEQQPQPEQQELEQQQQEEQQEERHVQAKANFCKVGYIMDTFCIDLGTLLDRPDLRTLKYPDQHSVHCLIEVPSCVSSGYEVLGPPPPGSTDYVRLAKLDANGNRMVVKLAAAEGICGSCGGSGTISKGFKATVIGTVASTGNPPMLTVTQVLSASVGCGTQSTPKPVVPATRRPTRKPTKRPTKRPIKRPTRRPTRKPV